MTGGHTTNEGAAEEGTGLPFTTSSLLQIDASFLSTFFASFFVIVCSELGDKVRKTSPSLSAAPSLSSAPAPCAEGFHPHVDGGGASSPAALLADRL